ncbi:MAG: hypothetical protein JNK82_24030 [Myxococcaceae bacterium]|nr:hypothetical protein [Myxococcaceae bacterium]
MRLECILAVVLLALACDPKKPGPVTFAPVGELPERAEPPALLTSFDGAVPVTDGAGWYDFRRGELKALLTHYVYGAMPSPVAVEVVPQANVPLLLPGVDYREYAVNVEQSWLYVAVFSPSGVTRPPVLLGLNKCGNHTLVADERVRATTSLVISACDGSRGSQSALWPVAEVVAAGYALATFHESDAAPDDPARYRDGLIRSMQVEGSPAARWGALSAWAYGLSRAVDLLQALDIDTQRITLVGHSRRGKAALWAAANDERVAAVVAHQSGRGGAPLTRDGSGETVELINSAFPHWFDGVFPTFAGNERRLPVDQHALLALVAPRRVLLSEGDDDAWADPQGSKRSLELARPVWPLLGAEPESKTRWQTRPGGHEINREDWQRFIAWEKGE